MNLRTESPREQVRVLTYGVWLSSFLSLILHIACHIAFYPRFFYVNRITPIGRWTPLIWLSKLRHPMPGIDSFAPMHEAYFQLFHTQNYDIYRGLWESLQGPRTVSVFWYPFPSLLYSWAIDHVARVAGAQHVLFVTDVLNALLCWAALIGTGVVLYRMIQHITRAEDAAAEEQATRGQMIGLTLALMFTYCALIWVMVMGQAQVFINFLFAAGMLFLLRRSYFSAGVMTGLICLLKPQYGIVLLWGIVARRFRFVAGAAVTVVIAVVLAGAIFGFAREFSTFPEYGKALHEVTVRGEARSFNSSLNGLVNRWMHTADPYDEVQWFAPYNRTVAGVSMVFTVLMLIAALWSGLRRVPDALAFGFAGLCGLLGSSVAEQYHYGSAVGLFVIFAFYLFQQRQMTAVRGAILFASYTLLSAYFLVPLGWASNPRSLAFSYAFYGALLLFGLLVEQFVRQQSAPAGS